MHLKLVRMVLFTAEDATVDQKCAIAQDLLDGFSRVPVFFLRAISSPLVRHVATIVEDLLITASSTI